jgi:hypothetical protein
LVSFSSFSTFNNGVVVVVVVAGQDRTGQDRTADCFYSEIICYVRPISIRRFGQQRSKYPVTRTKAPAAILVLMGVRYIDDERSNWKSWGSGWRDGRYVYLSM